MLATLPPMINDLELFSIPTRESSDVMGSNARKRRREILSNKPTKIVPPKTIPVDMPITMPSLATTNKSVRKFIEFKEAVGNLQNMGNTPKLPQRCDISSDCFMKGKVPPPSESIVQPKVIKSQINPLDKNGVTKKKPQMRYDPSVPMTKEEAAVWRREQRRKRNRDSAAASRQRQRNRILELEGEVAEWKKKIR